ncbi:hypothetical protein DE146DRAFT_768235 [Phaeosphaeria sp. MPI-PUGE-AT-0046c]|nr:hypothetical protein DE146DRAFT_768235 [Phaeosphaeria sp. MPI-PUGE-AT-0046c]
MPKMQIKTPKGTRDWAENSIAHREAIFSKIRKVFENHNGKEIDTPVFELKSILTDKYGEDSKLIYDLEDQGGEICALRYDLTVPFARWLAMNNVRQIKRFQIGKIYRRDQPAIERGRMREFYQCDFDFAGDLDLMISDSEVLCITAEVFEMLELDVTIKINHRLILDGIFSAVGVPENLLRATSSAVDKLDKLSWDEVKKEMEEKGLDGVMADKIGLYMELLLQYLQASDTAQYITFDLSLARGLDYYTCLIYEVTPNDSTLKVGSIAAGGRYDNLVGTFSRRDIPCVGISFGIDRILTILGARSKELMPASKICVYIVAFGSNLLVEKKMTISRQLRRAGISVDFDTKANRNLRKQVELAESNGAVVTILLEDDASVVERVRVKIFATRAGKIEDSVVIDQAKLVEEVQRRLS